MSGATRSRPLRAPRSTCRAGGPSRSLSRATCPAPAGWRWPLRLRVESERGLRVVFNGLSHMGPFDPRRQDGPVAAGAAAGRGRRGALLDRGRGDQGDGSRGSRAAWRWRRCAPAWRRRRSPLVLPASRRGWTRRTWAVGAAYAMTVVLFVLANKETTSANAIFLQSTAPALRAAGRDLRPARARARPRRAGDAGDRRGAQPVRLGPRRGRRDRPGPAARGTSWRWSRGWRGRPRCWACADGARRGGMGAAAGAAVAGNLIAFVVCLPAALPPVRRRCRLGADDLPGRRADRLAYMLLTAAVRYVSAFEVVAAAAGGARPEPGLVVARARRGARRGWRSWAAGR